MKTRILGNEDAHQWCARCDDTREGPGIVFETIFGTVVTGAKSMTPRIRDMYGAYVGVGFFLCKECLASIGLDIIKSEGKRISEMHLSELVYELVKVRHQIDDMLLRNKTADVEFIGLAYREKDLEDALQKAE